MMFSLLPLKVTKLLKTFVKYLRIADYLHWEFEELTFQTFCYVSESEPDFSYVESFMFCLAKAEVMH